MKDVRNKWKFLKVPEILYLSCSLNSTSHLIKSIWLPLCPHSLGHYDLLPIEGNTGIQLGFNQLQSALGLNRSNYIASSVTYSRWATNLISHIISKCLLVQANTTLFTALEVFFFSFHLIVYRFAPNVFSICVENVQICHLFSFTDDDTTSSALAALGSARLVVPPVRIADMLLFYGINY